jgi:hypothetical protein
VLPWIVVALDSLFASDAQHPIKVYLFLASVWTYPLAVVIVAMFRKKAPLIVLLPCLPLAVLFTSDWWW